MGKCDNNLSLEIIETVTWKLVDIYLTTLLTSPIEFPLYFQNYIRHLNQNFREMRKIYEIGVRSKIMRETFL